MNASVRPAGRNGILEKNSNAVNLKVFVWRLEVPCAFPLPSSLMHKANLKNGYKN